MEKLITTINDLPLSEAIRQSLLAFPLIETTHVIAITMVFGAILIVDLRLLGIAWKDRPFTRLAPELLRWTWIAFGVAAVTGALMFISNAHVYFNNTPFRLKMVFMLLAGVNMAVFQLFESRSVQLWDRLPSAPTAGRIAAALSLCLWIGVVGAGRWIGFTSTQGATVAKPAPNVDFDDFLGGGDPTAAPPPAPVSAPAAN
jgi:hypothetical protein